MTQNAPGYSPVLMKLLGNERVSEAGPEFIQVAGKPRAAGVQNCSQRRMMQALNDAFSGRPEAALGMEAKMRLVLAQRERAQAGTVLK